jgi:hypothetical protein
MRDQKAYPNRSGCTMTELEVMGWDSFEDGGDKDRDGYHNDWNTSYFVYDEENHTVEIDGTSCLGEFEFEITIKPYVEVSKQEIERTQEYMDARYLLALSEKIIEIPVQYGTDGSDYDELRAIAARLDEQAVTDALDESD